MQGFNKCICRDSQHLSATFAKEIIIFLCFLVCTQIIVHISKSNEYKKLFKCESGVRFDIDKPILFILQLASIIKSLAHHKNVYKYLSVNMCVCMVLVKTAEIKKRNWCRTAAEFRFMDFTEIHYMNVVYVRTYIVHSICLCSHSSASARAHTHIHKQAHTATRTRQAVLPFVVAATGAIVAYALTHRSTNHALISRARVHLSATYRGTVA